MSSREAFEEWADNYPLDLSTYVDGEYVKVSTNAAWEAWVTAIRHCESQKAESEPQTKETLRDKFAMAVVGHIWATYQTDGTAREFDNWRQGVAIESYRLAEEMINERDAMLKEREK